MLITKPLLVNSPSLTTLPSLANMPPSSATLPSWAKLLPWANLPSLAKLPSLAISPLGKDVRTCLLWQSCHWGHCQHPTGVDAGVVLSSLRTSPWRHCHHRHCGAGVIVDVALAVLSPPLHGRQRPPLDPQPFCHLPSAIGARLGLCPFVVHFSELISLIVLALAPAPTAVWPAFMANGTRPLVSAFLANLRVWSTPSKAGSLSSSKTLPALFFCQLSWFQAALFRFWGVTTPASPRPVPASACNAPWRSLWRGRRPPLGLQCPVAEATMNGKESCTSAQY